MVQLAFVDAEGRRWHARVDSFVPVDSLDLPRVINVSDGTYDIRVVVTRWVNGELAVADPVDEPEKDPKKPTRLKIPGADT